MWVFPACRARTLPFEVSLKRFFAPEWVFIFGMRRPLKQTRAGLTGSARRLPLRARGDHVGLGRELRVALAEHHERVDHLGREPLVGLAIRERLEPVAARVLDLEAGLGELRAELGGGRDAPVAAAV